MEQTGEWAVRYVWDSLASVNHCQQTQERDRSLQSTQEILDETPQESSLGAMLTGCLTYIFKNLYWKGAVSSKIMSGVLLPSTEATMEKKCNLLLTNREVLIVPDCAPRTRLSAKVRQTCLQLGFRIVQSIPILPQDSATTCSTVYSLAYTQIAKISFKAPSKYE